MRSLRAVLLLVSLCSSCVAGAADLSIGLGADVTSMDPQYHNLTPNNAIAFHVFGFLVQRDPKERLEPSLAVEWNTVDPTTWEFKLRRGVKFHDGSDFTAEDVIASIRRVPKVPNSPSPFTAYTKQIVKIDAVDPYTVRFHTATPYPLMPSDMTQVAIISHKFENATTEDFNSGKAAVGTGPYKLVRYAKGDRIELARFDGWWGGKTPWEHVTMRLLPQNAARVAALLSGDVKVIENVPTADLARLKQDKRLSLYRSVADRLIYIHLDSNRDVSPFVTDRDGKALERNPLKDARVRKALSKAIDRPTLIAKIMEGEAVPAGQLVPDFLFGATKNLKPEKYDPEGAKKLLAEAGWPEGFGVTLHTPNDRYVNDSKIAQAVAQMWTRIGVPTKVVAMPSATYFPQATELKFSTMLLGWSTGTGEASSSLKNLLMTFNKDRGFGGTNRGRYSNGKVDAFTEDALQTVDDVKREAYLQRATEIAINDTAIIPVHFQVNTWAARDGIVYVPRVDETTLAWQFRPAGK
ncbi:MAG TPA: ABC transporter substrate-binding protein [Casimicrobiaceae bacterium]|nr:ABC transporter substrate-binding protein [Casimicrobiaceae bacterium]